MRKAKENGTTKRTDEKGLWESKSKVEGNT